MIYQQKPNWPIISNLTIQHIGALLAPFTFSPTALFLALFLHWFVGSLGITLGYHRLLTHRSFKTHKWLEYTLATIGCLAAEGGPIEWVGIHRLHHKLDKDRLKLFHKRSLCMSLFPQKDFVRGKRRFDSYDRLNLKGWHSLFN